ncbi:MAG: HEPN domain-containing protein [Blastocatellia bacterium]
MDWKNYWLKGKENLEVAALAYQSKRYNACASRAYYVVFLASIAALIQLADFRAKDNEWQHGQVQAELNRQLIMRRKLLPSELGRTPMDLMELRHLADYKSQSVTAREAKRAYDRAMKFLSAIKHALGETA